MEEGIGMQDADTERLINCFEQAFPGLSRSAIPAATHENVATWDSIAQVTLMSLIGEEFGLDIDFEEFDGATSFAAIQAVVGAKIGKG